MSGWFCVRAARTVERKRDQLDRSGLRSWLARLDTDEHPSGRDSEDHKRLKIELKNGRVQSFNTRWHETIIAMKKQPGDEIPEMLYYRQLQESGLLNSRNCSKDPDERLRQTTKGRGPEPRAEYSWEAFFSSPERRLEKPA